MKWTKRSRINRSERKRANLERSDPAWLKDTQDGVEKVVRAFERLSGMRVCSCGRFPIHSPKECVVK